MPRILQGIERDVFTCCTCSGLFLGIQDFSFTESVLKKRVACIGTMQIIKGLGIPNKHFATQKWRLYRQKPCLLQLCWFWKVHSQWAVQTPKPKLQLRCAERTLPCLSYHARNRKLFSAISIAAFDWRRLSYRLDDSIACLTEGEITNVLPHKELNKICSWFSVVWIILYFENFINSILLMLVRS